MKFRLEDLANVPLNNALRDAALDLYDTDPITGHQDIVTSEIYEKFQNHINTLEREAFMKAVRLNDGPKFDNLTPQQQEDLYQNVRAAYIAQPRYTTARGIGTIDGTHPAGIAPGQ